MRFPRLPALVAVFAAAAAGCFGAGADDRVARHAAAVLGQSPGDLRITSETELTGEAHEFYLVTAPSGRSLLVVVPKKGEIFDARTPDAFSRVARAENAAARLSQLGAERVASWFAALGGSCPPPPVDQAHFVEVTRQPEGVVQLRYVVGIDRSQGIERACVVDLAPDGSLKSSRTLEISGPRASGPSWRSDSRD